MAQINTSPILILLVIFAQGIPAAPSKNEGKAPLLKMNNGKYIPQIALGTFVGIQKDGAKKPEGDEVQKAVEKGIEAGYRHFDTAAFYFDEDQVGKGINNKIKDGTVKREDVFVTTKLWNDKHARSDVLVGLKDSLKQLNMDYVDLYLIHFPVSRSFTPETGKDIDYLETWKGMEDAAKQGLAKSIGVSNFNITQLQRLIDNAEIKPAVLEIEVNPNLTNKKLIEFAKNKDIVVMAYSPFGSLIPSRSTKDSPPPKIDDPILSEIGKKYGKTTPQIVLRYLVDRGLIPIPKSFTPSRIEQNIDIFDFKLTPEEIEKIDSFNKNYRIVEPTIFKPYPNYPFHSVE